MSEEEDRHLFPEHRDCETLTGLMVEHLPRDGSIGRERRYGKGADMWVPGDRADTLFFLRSGQVTIMHSDGGHGGAITRVVGEGEPFGELCVCAARGGTRGTVARAAVESEVLEVPQEDFLRFLRRDREAFLKFVVTFCIRLSEAERRNEVLAHRGAEDRLGHLLLLLATSRGTAASEEGQGKKALEASHDELAREAALSRSHVTVTMGRFRKRGLVAYGRGRPLVVDVPALEDFLRKGSG